MVLLISLVLAFIPLLGIVWIVLLGSALTVDGLFTSLILLAISGVFRRERVIRAAQAALQIRQPRGRTGEAGCAARRGGAEPARQN